MPQFQNVLQDDFSKGVDAKSNPYGVAPNAVRRAMNMTLSEIGSLRTRDGYVLNDSNGPADAENRAIGAFSTATLGLAGLIVAKQASLPANRVYQNNASPPWTVRVTLSQNYELPQIIQFGNIVAFTDAYTPPKYWDGVTLASAITAGPGQTVPIGALHAVAHNNQFWVFNTAPGMSALDGPTSLRASDVLNINSWPNGNQVFIGDSSDKGMGLASFTIGDTGIAPFPILVAFTGYRAYQINGTFGSADFSIQQIRTDQGCLAPRSIQFCPGFGIVRLTQRGFYVYDGQMDQCISTPVAPYIFGEDGLTAVDLAGSGYLSRGVLYPGDPAYYVCACPLVGSDVRRWFALNLLTKAWIVWDVPGVANQGLSALNVVRGFFDPLRIGGEVLLMAFKGSPNLYSMQRSATSDAGTPISWSVELPPLPPKSMLRRAYMRRMLAKVINVTAGQAVSATFAIGPANSPAYPTGGQQVVSTTAVVAAQAGATLGSRSEVTLNFDIGRSGEVQKTELAGQGPITLRGLEWQGTPKQTSRPMRA
jgi:hypothetical protein